MQAKQDLVGVIQDPGQSSQAERGVAAGKQKGTSSKADRDVAAGKEKGRRSKSELGVAAGKQKDGNIEAEQDEAAVKQDIVSLIQAMHSQLASELDHDNVPGYHSFAEVALAYGLPSIFYSTLDMRLEVSHSCVSLLP